MADRPSDTGPKSGGISGVMRRASGKGPERALDHRHLRADVRAGLFGSPKEDLRVGRFKLVNRLGSGGMGTVYAALDTQAGRTIALKVLESEDRELRSRLQREAKALSRLDHPNVVSVYEVGPYDDGIYLAMELVDGVSLRTWLGADRPVEDIMAVLTQVASALAAAHAIGIIHRDVKPENILVDETDHVSLLDFGLAKTEKRQSRQLVISGIESRVTRPGTRLGTVGYMAPEQIVGDVVDGRTDVFSLCVVAYEALYGEGPFPGETPEAVTLAVLKGEHAIPPSGRDVPAHVRDAVVAGIAFDPADRPPSMTDLAEQWTNPHAPGRDRATAAASQAGTGLFARLRDALTRGSGHG